MIIENKKGSANMKNYQYIFEDGYFCYSCGRLSRIDLHNEEVKHGKVISIVIV
jgi:hypothetical protein